MIGVRMGGKTYPREEKSVSRRELGNQLASESEKDREAPDKCEESLKRK